MPRKQGGAQQASPATALSVLRRRPGARLRSINPTLPDDPLASSEAQSNGRPVRLSGQAEHRQLTRGPDGRAPARTGRGPGTGQRGPAASQPERLEPKGREADSEPDSPASVRLDRPEAFAPDQREEVRSSAGSSKPGRSP
jgi:hypothetical protein